MKHYRFNISVSYEDFLQVYQGSARYLMIETDEGLMIKIQASHFLPFVSQLGIRGYFRLITDENNKFQSLERIT
ncbi:DUF2835 domain-containing protein [Celerinatantimonas sp. MCCC 1A17872]|uniref:DUF2835 domain-containing protein n=1 Tax=Celerinatantimonas sp. MCCC 1A17872 TaxID=3177514 RepID=UPI0038C5ADF7